MNVWRFVVSDFHCKRVSERGRFGWGTARRSWTLGWAAIAVALLFCAAGASGQAKGSAAGQTQKKVADGASEGFPLKATLCTNGDVSVEAVLLPPTVTANVFGKEIGDNYAAIAVTVTNRSDKTSLIINSIFIDYSGRLPSGSKGTGCSGPKSVSAPWQTSNSPCQVASAEYRIVRDDLQHRQPWTLRNIVVRSLVLVGAVASAYTFTLGGDHTVRSINAFNGQIIPAAQAFWPDPTVGQMNNISDLAFRVNKVVPQQSSVLVVAFYPMDRFLSPGLKDLYKKSPAVLFAPEAMMFDPQARKRMLPFIKPLLGRTTMKDLLPCYLQMYGQRPSKDCATPDGRDQATDGACAKDVVGIAMRLHYILQKVSLNTIHVVVGGILAVDVNTVPAQSTSVDISAPQGMSADKMWTEPGDYEGTINGGFLTGGEPDIAEAGDLGITNVIGLSKGSTDTQLKFKMTLTKSFPSTTKALTFTVEKKGSQGGSIISGTYQQPIVVPSTNPGDGKH
jgi:hypothetical protein